MKTRCIHQIYCQPKMFQTIGFHHQGCYSICIQAYSLNKNNNLKQYGFPILTKKMHTIQSIDLNQQHHVNKKQQSYHTKKFDVSFNEQQFLFNGGCRFKIQTDCHSQQQQNECQQPNENILYLSFKLIKYSLDQIANENQGQGQNNRGMFSTQSIIKQSMSQNRQTKDTSKEKVNSRQESKNNKKQKPISQVCQVIMQINTNIQSVSTSRSIYQIINFSQQQYFGKLFFMINYVKIGYKIRPNSLTIYDISNTTSLQILQMYKTQKGKQRLKKLKQPSQNILQIKIQQNIYPILSQIYPNACQLYKQLIYQQILQLNRIIQIQSDLLPSFDRLAMANQIKSKTYHNMNMNMSTSITNSQNNSTFTYSHNTLNIGRNTNTNTNINNNNNNFLTSSKSINTSTTFNTTTKYQYNNTLSYKKNIHSTININISIPDQWIYQSQQNLQEYYQCNNIQQLYLIIYQQNIRISQIIAYKWQQIINMMSKNKWNATYFHRTILNFKQQTDYIKNYRVCTEFIKENKICIPYKTQLKYKYHIHQNIPMLYMIKTMKNQRMYTQVSSQHTLFVLVHGFNGNQHDMSRVKSFIGYFCSPHFLVLKKISTKILQSLDIIGQTAAEEIKQFLKARPFIKRINFIGFSLGGVIIRACLPYMKEYYMYLNILITLSSPHLGVKEINSCIVKTGLQLLHRVKGIKNIKELLLDMKQQQETKTQPANGDQGNKRCQVYEEKHLCYLQSLAKDNSIGAFNLVVMCGAEEDKYVPGVSATLGYKGDNQRVLEMQKNIKKNVRNLHQIYVKFDSKKKGSVWDRVSGRRIHINFLDDDSFLHFLLAQYFHIF